jgi:tellurite resistance protein TerC
MGALHCGHLIGLRVHQSSDTLKRWESGHYQEPEAQDKLLERAEDHRKPLAGTSIQIWAALGITIAAAVALDFGIFHRTARAITLRMALMESCAWIGVSLLFNLWVYWLKGPQAGVQFLTGYLVEKSLSIDNILVFLVIFRAFRVEARRQHRVLYFGVAGALVLRGVFVYAGIELLQKFHVILYGFGAFLLVVGIRMFLSGKRQPQPEKSWMVRLTRRVVPVAEDYEGERFWVKRGGKWFATYLLLALVAVEAMDILFAVDSVPAVLGITRDAFIVYSSNAFAVLGLRSLYFALADLLPRFRFLHQGLAAILVFVGLKMTGGEVVPVSDLVSLAVIAGIIGVMVGASLVWPGGKRKKAA